MSNQSDPSAFLAFQQAFESQVSRRNLASTDARIQRRASFFETRAAKYFTLGCYLLLLGMGWIYFVEPDRFAVRHSVRLLIVILPGVAYLTYRVFLGPGSGSSRANG
ncbi:MAG: hypothetical protein KDB61_05235 [Planctomycetes bacterium]|nr:hypothetical protein [Planctomycetota bacterium]